MAQKPEIQYVGQFYVHGSEAKALELETKKKKAETKLPESGYDPIKKIGVDYLALCSILVAAAFLVTMVMGALSLEEAWREMEIAKQYVYELEDTNRTLSERYRRGLDMEKIRSATTVMGLIPVEEAQTMKLTVTMPEPEAESTVWDDIIWFLKGMFDKA